MPDDDLLGLRPGLGGNDWQSVDPRGQPAERGVDEHRGDAAITEQGLGSALEGVAQRLQLRPQLEDDLAPHLPTELVTAMFLSLSEALTNAARYSGAPDVVVRLRCERKVFTGEVADAGHGGAEFVPGGGLTGIKQRIGALGGRIELNSAANAGTRIRVVLPIET